MKKYYTIIAITFIVLGFGFYWYSYKPKHIRSQCLAEAESNNSPFSNPSNKERMQKINDYYKICLHRFGLEN